MRIPAAFGALIAVTACGAALVPTVPAMASGTQNLNPPRVCFKNESGEDLYFRAVYNTTTAGGTKLGSGGSFCSTRPLPNEVRISLERRSETLCTRAVAAGRTYTLTARSGGECNWSVGGN